MHLTFEQIDEAAGESGFSVVAGIDGNEIANSAGQNKALDFPDAERRAPPIADLNQDDLIAAAAFAR